MKPESLNKAANICVNGLGKDREIDVVDKMELMMLINTLLTPETYEQDRQALIKEEHKRKVLKLNR